MMITLKDVHLTEDDDNGDDIKALCPSCAWTHSTPDVRLAVAQVLVAVAECPAVLWRQRPASVLAFAVGEDHEHEDAAVGVHVHPGVL